MKCSYLIADHTVYVFTMPVVNSNMYILLEKDSALIIDPFISREAKELLSNLKVQYCTILLTHEHYDHISGVNYFRKNFFCRVICTKTCADRISDPKKNTSAYFPALFLSKETSEQEEILKMFDTNYQCYADEFYLGELQIQWNHLTLNLSETPGHSPGSQIIDIEKKWYFTGDSLIPGESVITRLPGGSRKDYEHIVIPYLRKISSDSIIFPGHGNVMIFSKYKGFI